MNKNIEAKKRLELPFTGIASFCKAPICTDRGQIQADIAILGAPFDLAIQLRSGTRMGPRAIRDASTAFSIGGMGYYDPELDLDLLEGIRIVDCGDVDIFHMDGQRSLQNIYEESKQIISQDIFLVVLGGDHAVPIPLVRAYEEKGPIHLIQFDSHLDFVDERAGIREGHNSTIRRVLEMDHVFGITQIGMHGVSSSSKQVYEDARKAGNTVITLQDFRKIGIDGVIATLPDNSRFYVTVDIDALDLSIAPGTGLPSLGGMYYREIMETLRGIAAKGTVVGFDLCEVAPQYDPAGITAFTAAGIIVEFLGAIFSRRNR